MPGPVQPRAGTRQALPKFTVAAASGSGSACGDQPRDVVVKLGQALIEGRETALVHSCELRQVGVSDLPMPDDPGQWHIGVGSLVRPELMALVACDGGNHGLRGVGRLAFADEQ